MNLCEDAWFSKQYLRETWMSCIKTNTGEALGPHVMTDTWDILEWHVYRVILERFFCHMHKQLCETARKYSAWPLLKQIKLSIHWSILVYPFEMFAKYYFCQNMFASEQSCNKFWTSERESFRIDPCIAKGQGDVYRIGAVCRTIVQYSVNICKVLCIVFAKLFWK
jgi:hypothetical protein